MTGILSQFGLINEVTYGTGLAPTKFVEITKENVVGSYARIESAGLRAGTRVQRSDRWVVNPKGASGSVEFEVQSKGFGWWLKQALGVVATGTLTDSTYTHTGTIGSLNGTSFSCQVGRPDNTQTVRPWLFTGGKVMTWQLSNSVDQLLMFSADMDFQAETVVASGVNVLAAASYPAGTQLLSFLQGSFKIAGSELPLKDITIKCDNGLDGNRYFIRTTTGQKEQLENAMRKITIDCTAEFTDLAVYNQFISPTVAGALASVTAFWQAPVLAGATTYPSLLVTATAARFDTATTVVDGPKLLEQKISFQIMYDGTNSPLQVAYCTTDVTPL